ncbi:hypothetical protein ACK8HX_04565 [Oryzobacter sp. R7]|uniref:hypothetical protein n=1 Tax=Oryzobacter faecalis TaxID=3388656 RepID=UPI00398D1A7D
MARTSDRPPLSARPTVGAAVVAGPDSPADLESDLAALRAALADHPFPTQQDDLLAHLLGGRRPVRLACRVAALSRTRSYASVDEVCAEIRRLAGAGAREA